jgi:hypothetical protein
VVADKDTDAKRRITLTLSLERLASIDALKKEWGMRNRGDVFERLLDDIFGGEDEDGVDEADDAPVDLSFGASADDSGEELDERTALVLVGSSALQSSGPASSGKTDPFDDAFGDDDDDDDDQATPRRGRGGGGIDLPGFVQRRSSELKRSLRTPRPGSNQALPALPRLASDLVAEAIAQAHEHWLGLYGTPANDTVLEAAMLWLAKDIWPQSDQSEGRAFTWSLTNAVMRDLVDGWDDSPPSFGRVMAAAGVLEDPFSGGTLPLRIPTLIRRFVHRFRRRQRGTSFQTLENTMTLQGALRLLQLPTDPGHRLSLAQIKESYRELALSHHPDAGGSLESMRRLNEAYQLLKELYRHRSQPPQ